MVVITDDQIIELCQRYFNIEESDISINDGAVNCSKSVSTRDILATRSITRLPIKFGKCDNDFRVNDVDLTTLEGCPSIIAGSFQCNRTKITSLVGGPTYVGGLYGSEQVNGKKGLVNLDGLPEYVGRRIFLSINQNTPLLKTLKVRCMEVILSSSSMVIKDILQNIINRNIVGIKEGIPLKQAIWKCQCELTENGYEASAKW
jgi:hypothetical protein